VSTRAKKSCGMGDSPVHPRLKPQPHGRTAHATIRSCAAFGFGILVLLTGCRKEDMADQPRQDTMDESRFFPDGQSARPLIDGTVPRGHAPIHDVLVAVSAGTQEPEATTFPADFKVTPATIENGRQHFDTFCSVCHGRLGDGEGMIVQRGFPKPPSYYTPRLRNAPIGHFYNVISNGYGAMYSYGDRIRPADRWAIAAYIRALQASVPNRMDPDISRASTQPSNANQP
jgi:mono/diheme cytochrome c family protein